MTRDGRPKDAEDRLLTPVELELMTVLWRRGEGTVHQVLEDLPSDRALAYTSVSTVLRILEQKGLVSSRRAATGRGHVYTPAIPKQEYEARSLKDLLGRVFDGAPESLVRCLVENETLSARQLAAIREALARRSR